MLQCGFPKCDDGTVLQAVRWNNDRFCAVSYTPIRFEIGQRDSELPLEPQLKVKLQQRPVEARLNAVKL